jgi:hypothetical protein
MASADHQPLFGFRAHMSRDEWLVAIEHAIDTSASLEDLQARFLITQTMILLDIRDRLPPLTSTGAP